MNILPCPFCGSTKGKVSNTNRSQYGQVRYSVCVRCPDCHARGSNVIYHHTLERQLSERKAIELWNRAKSLYVERNIIP